MSYIDQLKKEAKLIKARENDDKDQQDALEKKFRTDVRPQSRKIWKYLFDMVEQLNTIRPNISVNYKLAGYGELKNLMQSEYKLLNFEEEECVFELRFVCHNSRRVSFEKKSLAQADAQTRYLNKAGIKFEYLPEVNKKGQFLKGTFDLGKKISGRFAFSSDPKTLKILLAVKNFNDFSVIRYTIDPEEIKKDDFLDELARYITRDGSNPQFLDKYKNIEKKVGSNDKVREQILAKIKAKQQAKIKHVVENEPTEKIEPKKKRGFFNIFGK
jgi:hypothetical protein